MFSTLKSRKQKVVPDGPAGRGHRWDLYTSLSDSKTKCFHTTASSSTRATSCVPNLLLCSMANIRMGSSCFWYRNTLGNGMEILCICLSVRDVELDEKLENQQQLPSSSQQQVCLFPGPHPSAPVAHLRIHWTQTRLCYGAKMLNCQKRVTGCASLKNQLELTVLQLFT